MFAINFLVLAALLTLSAQGQVTHVSLNPEADAFVSQAAPADNFGRAGALSVAGASATNAFGLPGGRAESLARFNLSETVLSLDHLFGNHDWWIARARLHLYEMGAPNNPSFGRGVGAFEIRWLASGDDWIEGTGSPNVPTMDGVAFQNLASLLDPARDLTLGVYTNTGMDSVMMIDLPLTVAWVDDLRSAAPTTLHFRPASDSVGYTFLSRSDPRIESRLALELTVASGPPPRITSIQRTETGLISIRFVPHPDWTHILQYREDLPAGASTGWLDFSGTQVPLLDGQTEVLDGVTNRQRFYRLSIAPP